MIRKFSFLIACVLMWNYATAQDTIYPVSNLCNKKSFTYRLVKTEYIDNGNNYFIGNTQDTSYLIFENTGKPRVFKIKTCLDEEGKKPLRGIDSLRRIIPEIEFNKNGKIIYLRNWTTYRDLIVSYYSAQVRAATITPSEFKEMRDSVNVENTVRRMVIEDINYLFALNGDSFRTDIEYLRIKAVRSPISDQDYMILGNLKVEHIPGTKYSVLFKSENRAGPGEKPMLMEEARAYLRKKTPANEPVSEITGVGMNSEQEYQYNTAQQRMMKVTFSDVFVLDMSSRGNIRSFQLWDIVE
jgi:hypothetical protein